MSSIIRCLETKPSKIEKLLPTYWQKKLDDELEPRGGPGVAQVLFYQGELLKHDTHELLHAGCCLQFQWLEAEVSHDVNPEYRRNLAHEEERIKTLLRGEGLQAEQLEGYHLHPYSLDNDSLGVRHFWQNKEAIALTYESGTFILAASLYLAVMKVNTMESVWASAAWDGGLAGVEGIEEKIDAIYRMMEKSGEKEHHLFVSPLNYEKAKKKAEKRAKDLKRKDATLSVYALDVNESNFIRALKPLLNKLDMPPGKDSSLEEKLAYANREYLDFRKRSSYFESDLAKPLAEALRLREGFAYQDVDTLVMVLSKNMGLCYFLHELYKPKRSVVVVTEQTARSFDQVKERYAQAKKFEYCEDMGEFLKGLKAFVGEGVASRTVVVDLTSGQAKHSVLLYEFARARSYDAIYLQHYHNGARVEYSVERTQLDVMKLTTRH